MRLSPIYSVLCANTHSCLLCALLLLLLKNAVKIQQTKWIMDAWVAITYQFTRITTVAWFFSDELNKVLHCTTLYCYLSTELAMLLSQQCAVTLHVIAAAIPFICTAMLHYGCSCCSCMCSSRFRSLPLLLLLIRVLQVLLLRTHT
jgi:hypothetical protein